MEIEEQEGLLAILHLLQVVLENSESGLPCDPLSLPHQ